MGQTAIGIGAFFSGPICDKFGRRKTLIFGFAGTLIFGYTLPFMPNWWSFTIAWAGIHFPLFFTNTASAVFVVEIIGPSKRSLATLSKIIIHIFSEYNFTTRTNDNVMCRSLYVIGCIFSS